MNLARGLERRAAEGRPVRVGLIGLGLAQGVPLRRAVAAGAVVRWDDVTLDPTDPAGGVLHRRQAAQEPDERRARDPGQQLEVVC